MIKIDFGSGYNPKRGYKTCDFTNSPNLDYLARGNRIYSRSGEVKENTVNEIYCRNVIHHIKDFDDLFNNFYKYIKKNGKLKIIDCRKDYYYSNFFMDRLWYRFINYSPNIYISENYRDYETACKKAGFILINKSYKEEKEILVFKKI